MSNTNLPANKIVDATLPHWTARRGAAKFVLVNIAGGRQSRGTNLYDTMAECQREVDAEASRLKGADYQFVVGVMANTTDGHVVLAPIPAFDFAWRLKTAREMAQHTQGALAEIMDVDRQQVVRWESEGAKPPRVETIEKLAEALNVAPGWLAFGEEKR